MIGARWSLAFVLIAFGILFWYLLALAGEPQSEWLWCSVGRLC